MKNTLIILSILFSSTASYAGSSSLIAVESDANPNKTAYIGVNFDSKNVINSLFYKRTDGSIKNFAISDLSKSQVLYSKKGYDLVFIRVPSVSPLKAPTSLSLTLIFQKNVFCSELGSRTFTVKFNQHLGKFEMYNESGRQISKALATSHKNNFGITVGIDDFRTQ